MPLRSGMEQKSSTSGGGEDSAAAKRPADIKKLNDAVYLLHEPEGDPVVEIVFIHGLQLSNYKDAFWKTWIARDGSESNCWPMTWLIDVFPKARVLSLSYDSSAWRTDNQGRMDLYATGESLFPQMMIAGIGQKKCPVIFVCHSLGGLTVKSIMLQAHRKGQRDENVQNFLQNVAGFQFYATPHNGSKLADWASNVPGWGPMVRVLEVINNELGRLNSEFDQLEKESFQGKWKFAVVAEKNATRAGSFYKDVVEETSARHNYSKFISVGADHFDVCKPEDKTDTSFQWLTNFISDDLKIGIADVAMQELLI